LQNIKLSSVLGKITGATARSILEGLASKMTMKPEKLALLARHKRVRDRQPELAKASAAIPTITSGFCFPNCWKSRIG
jgi:hypothetical protein